MDDLDGTGQGSPRTHAAPRRGSSVDLLSERSTVFSTRQRAAGTRCRDSNPGARHPRGSCTARSFCPLLSRDEHNCSSRNSWPQTLLSAHIAHGTLTRPHRDHTVEERGVERSAASLDTHGHARRSQSSARSAGPVWRARARRCARASQQLGQGLGLGALTARGRVATAGGRRMLPSRGLVDDHGRHPALVRPAPPGSCVRRRPCMLIFGPSSWYTSGTRSTEHVGPERCRLQYSAVKRDFGH